MNELIEKGNRLMDQYVLSSDNGSESEDEDYSPYTKSEYNANASIYNATDNHTDFIDMISVDDARSVIKIGNVMLSEREALSFQNLVNDNMNASLSQQFDYRSETNGDYLSQVYTPSNIKHRISLARLSSKMEEPEGHEGRSCAVSPMGKDAYYLEEILQEDSSKRGQFSHGAVTDNFTSPAAPRLSSFMERRHLSRNPSLSMCNEEEIDPVSCDVEDRDDAVVSNFIDNVLHPATPTFAHLSTDNQPLLGVEKAESLLWYNSDPSKEKDIGGESYNATTKSPVSLSPSSPAVPPLDFIQRGEDHGVIEEFQESVFHLQETENEKMQVQSTKPIFDVRRMNSSTGVAPFSTTILSATNFNEVTSDLTAPLSKESLIAAERRTIRGSKTVTEIIQQLQSISQSLIQTRSNEKSSLKLVDKALYYYSQFVFSCQYLSATRKLSIKSTKVFRKQLYCILRRRLLRIFHFLFYNRIDFWSQKRNRRLFIEKYEAMKNIYDTHFLFQNNPEQQRVHLVKHYYFYSNTTIPVDKDKDDDNTYYQYIVRQYQLLKNKMSTQESSGIKNKKEQSDEEEQDRTKAFQEATRKEGPNLSSLDMIATVFMYHNLPLRTLHLKNTKLLRNQMFKDHKKRVGRFIVKKCSCDNLKLDFKPIRFKSSTSNRNTNFTVGDIRSQEGTSLLSSPLIVAKTPIITSSPPESQITHVEVFPIDERRNSNPLTDNATPYEENAEKLSNKAFSDILTPREERGDEQKGRVSAAQFSDEQESSDYDINSASKATMDPYLFRRSDNIDNKQIIPATANGIVLAKDVGGFNEILIRKDGSTSSLARQSSSHKETKNALGAQRAADQYLSGQEVSNKMPDHLSFAPESLEAAHSYPRLAPLEHHKEASFSISAEWPSHHGSSSQNPVQRLSRRTSDPADTSIPQNSISTTRQTKSSSFKNWISSCLGFLRRKK